MKKIFLVLLFSLIMILTCLAQEKEQSKIEWNMTGQIGLSYGKTNATQFLFLNYGGPNAKLNIKKWQIGLSMFPSLRYDLSKNKIIPTLGSGFFMGKNNWSIILPCYYLSNTESWIVSVGLGYRFK